MQSKLQGKSIRIWLSVFIVLSFILSGTGVAFSQLAEDSSISTIKFAQVSDVHYDSISKDNGSRLYSHSRELLADAINQLNLTNNLEFVVFSGDSINRPSRSDFIEFLTKINELNVPWYLSRGNHERSASSGFSKQERINLINAYNNTGFRIDKSCYSFSPKPGYLFIVMDGVIDSIKSSHGYFSRYELSWLDQQLTQNPASKVIIVQHFPLVPPYSSSSHTILNLSDYKRVLKKHKNVIAVLSGHYHGTKITKVNNVAHISTPSLVQFPNAFRVITITDNDGKIYIKSEFKETGLKNLQQYSKAKLSSWQLHYGQLQDRDAEIVLDKQM